MLAIRSVCRYVQTGTRSYRPQSRRQNRIVRCPTGTSRCSTRPRPTTPRYAEIKHGASSDRNQKLMEVEVKLGLPTAEDHAKVKTLFADYYLLTYHQENYFFDGTNQELSSKRHIMRIRIYNEDYKAILTLKGRATLQDGIGSASEIEEEIDVSIARQCLKDPSLLLQQDNLNLIKKIKQDFGVQELVALGGFRNIRDEHSWDGYKLELDQTMYDFGTNYELECETDHPEDLRDKIEQIFNDNGINYKYRTSTKFACFMNRSLIDEE